MRKFHRLSLLIIAIIGLQQPVTIYALSSEQRKALLSDILYFDVEESSACVISTSGASNTDYAGRPILSEAELNAIQTNSPVYQEAAAAVDIPWQMIAVVHLRENRLKVENPDNGQGIYQFVNKQGGPYPTGPVDKAEFTRQSKLAGEFLKGKAKGNYKTNQELTANSGPEVIKDTFFGYNGRNKGYRKQAQDLGYDPESQGYEGSPYVMNKADAPRDPDQNKTTWGQVKNDGGPIEYPANNDYGAFVVYASLAGISLSCSSTGELAWPEEHSTQVTSCFGPRPNPEGGEDTQQHYGIDITGGAGTPILAAADGEVVHAGEAPGYGPHYVVIKHGSGYNTGYGHMSDMAVKLGDKVTKGQRIGSEGSEGRSTGSHLHFNVFPGDYNTEGENGHVNPLQNGLIIPSETANPLGCK